MQNPNKENYSPKTITKSQLANVVKGLFIPIKDVAAILGVPAHWVHYHKYDKDFPIAVKVGLRHYWRKSKIIALKKKMGKSKPTKQVVTLPVAEISSPTTKTFLSKVPPIDKKATTSSEIKTAREHQADLQRLNQLLEEAIKREKPGVVERIKNDIRVYGITSKDLGL
jgi:hypothetical protein